MTERQGPDEVIENLMDMWVQAKSNGYDGLCEEIWDKMVAFDREQSDRKLKDLRTELEDLGESKVSC